LLQTIDQQSMQHGRSHRVLIVDDDVEVRTALSELFSSHGYDVVLAADGGEAIHHLEPRPCVVLVDLLMPGVVGQELLEYMRGHAELAEVPVAIISGSPHLAPDGYTVFPKPVDGRMLLDFVCASCEHDHSVDAIHDDRPDAQAVW
jgi:FixJ family two-component response regulator